MRIQARKWRQPLNPDKWCWISIGEPEASFTHIFNPILDSLPNLKISFWDLSSPLEGYEMPTEEDCRAIVEFILENKGKRVIVNCAAGISRSGAVARFCEECLGYEWFGEGKGCAIPNIHMFLLMRHILETIESK